MASRPQPSLFLNRLPVELRLEIYAYAILDCRAITVGTAQLDGDHADIVHRLYGNQRSPFKGIPQHHEPVVETEYRASLLSSNSARAVIPLTPATVSPPARTYEHTQAAYHTLLRLCKQVNDEVASHFALSSRRQTSLFVQYPHGLHVLRTLTPQLLRQSRSVHLAGTYVPRQFCPPRAARLGAHHLAPAHEELQGKFTPDHKTELGDLLRSCFGRDAAHPVDKFEMRVYYPGDDSYSTVWGDDCSPIVIALHHIGLADITIEIWRGRFGTGAFLTAKQTAEKNRVVSTVWRRLEEGRRGEPEIGSFVVDPTWPKWSAEHEIPTSANRAVWTSGE